MPSEKTIEVVVLKDGSTKINVEGHTGGSCLKATAALEAELGLVTGRTEKPELHEQTSTTTQKQKA